MDATSNNRNLIDLPSDDSILKKIQFGSMGICKNLPKSIGEGKSLIDASSRTNATDSPFSAESSSYGIETAASKPESSIAEERPIEKKVNEISMRGSSTMYSASETPFAIPALPFDDNLLHGLQDLQLSGLGVNGDHDTNTEKGFDWVAANSNCTATYLKQTMSRLSSGYGFESAHNLFDTSTRLQPAISCIQERGIGWPHSVQAPMAETSMGSFMDNSFGYFMAPGVNRNTESVSSNNLKGSSASQGNEFFQSPTSASITDRILQSQLSGIQEREIRMVGSLGMPTYEADPSRFAHCFPQEFCGLHGEFSRQNSISCCQPSDYLNRRQYSDFRNTLTRSRGNLEDLKNRVRVLDDPGFQMMDPSLLQDIHTDIIPRMAMDQMGCHYLQGILATKDPLATKKILDGTLAFVVELMIDQFGNFVFQRLLESCNQHQIEVIVDKLTSKSNRNESILISVANTKYGTRSIQKLVKVVRRSASLLDELTSVLIPGLLSLMNNIHGTHVIRELSHIQSSHDKLLYKAVRDHCLEMATKEKGCITLNICIDNSRSLDRELLLKKISESAMFLSQDPFGNYVVQHILALEIPSITDLIANKLDGHYVRLSKQKCGSHVVEKCLTSSRRDSVIWELVYSGKLGELVRDQCGNYVIQTALIASKGSNLQPLLIETIESDSQSRWHQIGKNVFKTLSEVKHQIDQQDSAH